MWLGEMKYPAPADAIARLWGPEHGRVVEVLGLRGYESRPRMYGILSSGSFLAKGPAPHVSKARPIYDWRDRDVWLAIHQNDWAYNHAYDQMYRLRPNMRELRVAVPTSIEAMNHWDDWQTLEPEFWTRVRRRFPNIHSLAMFDHDLHRPVRRGGETWQDAAYRYLAANLVEDRSKIERDLNKILSASSSWAWS